MGRKNIFFTLFLLFTCLCLFGQTTKYELIGYLIQEGVADVRTIMEVRLYNLRNYERFDDVQYEKMIIVLEKDFIQNNIIRTFSKEGIEFNFSKIRPDQTFSQEYVLKVISSGQAKDFNIGEIEFEKYIELGFFRKRIDSKGQEYLRPVGTIQRFSSMNQYYLIKDFVKDYSISMLQDAINDRVIYGYKKKATIDPPTK